MNRLRERLGDVSGQLQKFALQDDEKLQKPKLETAWHDSLLNIGIAALQAGPTNTLTIGSARAEKSSARAQG